MKGPLATGASLSESLALEYGQGMQGGALGWGRLDLPKLTRIMELHNLYSGITRRDPAIAGHNAAVLATRVLQAVAAQGDAARLTVFLGHDTNLDNLAGVFGLHWTLPGQPDDTPPDGELVFETWRENGAETVRLKLRYQTAAQLRDAAALSVENPPGELALAPAYCAASGCGLAELQRAAAAHIPAGCVPHG